jgi:hypothetical protein
MSETFSPNQFLVIAAFGRIAFLDDGKVVDVDQESTKTALKVFKDFTVEDIEKLAMTNLGRQKINNTKLTTLVLYLREQRTKSFT